MKIKPRSKRRRKVLRLANGLIAEIDHNEQTMRFPQLNKHLRLKAKHGAQ
jgi:hypothetical protein